MKRFTYRLGATLHIGFDQNIDFSHLAFFHGIEHALQLGRVLIGQLVLTNTCVTRRGKFTRLALILDHENLISSVRYCG